MTRLINVIAALAALTLAGGRAYAEDSNPVANPAAVVTSGNARFTVLTDRLIRMEWSADGKFEDRASLAVINRNLPVPKFTATSKGGKLTIRTAAVTLSYSGGQFSADNLSVSFKMNGKNVVWKPGMSPEGNLKGTTRTLDGCLGFAKLSKREAELENGILSRDGWAIVDESTRHLLEKDGSDWGEWVVERPEGERQDYYIFAYGHDYTAALADFTKVAGRIPMPPKYTLGYWWSRYWIYTDEEMLSLAREMRSNNIPIDVFIVDMDWHLTWKKMDERYGHDEFDQRRGWTGYTWNRDLFMDPEGFLGELHALGLKTSLNLHPASGIRPYEDCYNAFVKDYLSRTTDYDGPENYIYGEEQYSFSGVEKPAGKPGSPAPVPFRMDQREWADAYFNSVIHPLEKQGVDFWWLDWQQWRESRYVKDLSNTFWLNYTFFNDKLRQSASLGTGAPRPLIYHRWGGLGSHRYQLGFSGDTYDEWDVLGFLPYFTATASNVGYGWWGHDIGGHMQRKGHDTDPQMYTRWLQYGVFTPIFKTHSTQSAFLERRIWMFPEHYEFMKEAIELRYALSPYIYDAARTAWETGVCLCRPLYYYWPEEQAAYERNQEFLFGDRILATVIDKPVGADGKAEREIWFPKGCDWFDMAHKDMHKGGKVEKLRYSIDENPWYVRSGAILPLAAEGIKNLQEDSGELRLLVVPGKEKSTYVHHEDDGSTQAYATDYATTTFTKECSGSTVRISVSAREGSYAGMKDNRRINVILAGRTAAPTKVSVNGKEVRTEPVTGNLGLSLALPETPASQELVIEISGVR